MTNIGDRMKGYESVWDERLPPRMPVIVRLDGNSFSRLTKSVGFKKPYDQRFRDAMVDVCTELLDYCSGAIVAYSQSDEISILLRNDQTHDTDPFLGNRVQKMCSLLASIAAVTFTENIGYEAAFDCRAFVLPEAEVNNYFLWRQQDAFRNCVNSYCHYCVTPRKSVEGMDVKQRQEVLFAKAGININDVPVWHRRGFVMRRVVTERELDTTTVARIRAAGKEPPTGPVVRSSWQPDFDADVFSTTAIV